MSYWGNILFDAVKNLLPFPIIIDYMLQLCQLTMLVITHVSYNYLLNNNILLPVDTTAAEIVFQHSSDVIQIG